MKRLPTQTDLLLPLLKAIDDQGGAAKPSDIYDAVAQYAGVDEQQRTATERIGADDIRLFDRSVRWARQKAVFKGLLVPGQRNRWELTDAGHHALRNARRGTMVTVFETSDGVVLWGNAEDAVGIIEAGSVDLIVTSPPYPLIREKAYGNLPVRKWLDWMLGLAEGWRGLLAERGSLFLNLGPVWAPGVAVQEPYIERLTIELIDKLGYRLAQQLQWHSPSRLPLPAEWVCVKRVRLKQTTETILWLSPSDNPKADNRKTLVPYSEAMRRVIAKGQKKATRPSGAVISEAFGRDNGGAIASNLIVASNTSSNDDYHRACREQGLPAHPAMFPEAIPGFAIDLCTDVGDVVFDPTAGALTTAVAAQRRKRRWIVVERSLTYIEGAIPRLTAA